MSVTYGSLCTGYDGIGMGLRLAGIGIEPAWMAENEPSVAEVLKREHPGVPNVGDIKTAPWHLAPATRIVSSGDPCQSISVAGRQAGRDDPRFLWPWVREAYRAVRPPWLFFENVANMVGHDSGRTMAERFRHLREDGYAVRWTVLGACAVGAPHHRHRWYALAAYVGPGAPEAVRVGGSKAICGAPRSGGRLLLPTPVARDGDGRGEGDAEYWSRRAAGGRTHGMPLGAAVTLLPTPDASMATRGGLLSQEVAVRRAADPSHSTNLDDAVATLLPTPMADRSGNNRGGAGGRGEDQPVRPSLDSVHALLPTPTAADGERTSATMVRGNPTLPGAAMNLLPTPTTSNSHGNDTNGRGELLLPGIVARPEVWGKFAEAVALWEQVTGVPAPEPTEPGAKGGRRLSPLLPEWMMGLPPGLLTEHLSRSDALKAAGNGVVPLAAAAAFRLLSS